MKYLSQTKSQNGPERPELLQHKKDATEQDTT